MHILASLLIALTIVHLNSVLVSFNKDKLHKAMVQIYLESWEKADNKSKLVYNLETVLMQSDFHLKWMTKTTVWEMCLVYLGGLMVRSVEESRCQYLGKAEELEWPLLWKY